MKKSLISFLALLFAFNLSISDVARAQATGAADAPLEQTKGVVKKPFKNDAEVGIVVTGGNSQTSTLSFKEAALYQWDKNVTKFSGSYLETSNNSIQQSLLWTAGLRYERELTPRLNIFIGEGLESDKFQNILQRYTTDIGAKHFFEKNEKMNWFAELGYRFNRENYPSGPVYFKNYSIIRAYHEIEYFWTKTFSTKWWFEYLPNVTYWPAYQINSELSVSTILTDMFSLKSGYQVRYYNAPPANTRYKTDTIFTTALVAKF
jgi:putative salt-induced outer membrane protein